MLRRVASGRLGTCTARGRLGTALHGGRVRRHTRLLHSRAVPTADGDARWLLHHGGWSANLLEVGGKDTPVMNAFSNILNNFPVRYATQQCRGMESICAPLQKNQTRRPVPVLRRLI